MGRSPGEQLLGEAAGDRPHVRAVQHVAGRHLQPGLGHGLAVALLAAGAGGEPQRVVGVVADERDPLVAQRQQVAGGQAAALHIVGHDGGRLRPGVEQHHRHARARQAGEAGGAVGSDMIRRPSAVAAGQRSQVLVAVQGDSTLNSTRS